ncbi:MAG: FAD-dependent oxidoreductase [Janthinobacterium lividum]
MTRVDVLVIGAGPAGIAAGTAAAQHGRKVVVLDDNASAGGQIWRAGTLASGEPTSGGGTVRRRALERLASSGAVVLGHRRIFAAGREGSVQVLHEQGGAGKVEEFGYNRLILATGARERFLPFPGWTLPGVYGAGGLQALVKSGLAVEGQRVVVAGTGPLLLAVAAHLLKDGAHVPLIAEQAPRGRLAVFATTLWQQPTKLLQGAGYRARLWRSRYRLGCWVTEALADSDGQALRAVRLTDGRRTWEEPCDLLACGYHLVPNTEIAALLGCEFDGLQVRVDREQQTSLPGVFCVGEPTGIAGLEAALVQGRIAGLAAADNNTDALQSHAAKERRFGVRLNAAFALRPELAQLAEPETIVCRCEDVPMERLRRFSNWTEAKLQTRCGMGPCQGRVCGPATEFLFGWKAHSVRPPLFPVPLEAFCTQNEEVELTKESA